MIQEQETLDAPLTEIVDTNAYSGSVPERTDACTGLVPATVVIAHRHRLYLDSLVRLLDAIEAVQLVGCAETEGEAVECVRRAQPNTVILEPFMPLPGGLALLSRLREASSTTKPLVILHTVDGELLMTALRNGAWGYFSRDASSQDIARAIQATRRGELWVERGVMRQLLLGVSQVVTRLEELPHLADVDVRGVLSVREQQVAARVVAGLCNKRIASCLNITESTVKAHLVNIFRKFDIHNRTQLARCLDESRGGA